MAYFKDLRDYIDAVRQIGELKEIDGADWNLELGTITQLVSQSQNPAALLFDKIKGYPEGYRVTSNLALTPKRQALVLGLPLNLKGVELVRALREKLREGFNPMPPVEVKSGPVLENIDTGHEVDLFKFPTPHWWEGDGGRYIGTGTVTIVKDPEEGWVNLGTYRIMIHDKDTATVNIENPGRHCHIIRQKYWDKGMACPAAVVCGHDPMIQAVGGLRIPWGVSEYDYAGWLKDEPIEVVKGPTTGLPIPATAEIVLEGEIVPPEIETRNEGPLAEWAGHYCHAKSPEAAFKVKSVLHRDNPIIMGVLPFLAPGVPYWISHIVRSAVVWDELERNVPGVKGVWQPQEFSALGAVAISLEQKYAGHVKQAALVAAGCGAVAQCLRYVIIVDDDVDVSDIRELMFAVGMRCDPVVDIDTIRRCWAGKADPLFTKDRWETGDLAHSIAIIDACKPYHWMKDFPVQIRTSPELLAKVKAKWRDVIEE
jgi:UbiD family decarboxylase